MSDTKIIAREVDPARKLRVTVQYEDGGCLMLKFPKGVTDEQILAEAERLAELRTPVVPQSVAEVLPTVPEPPDNMSQEFSD